MKRYATIEKSVGETPLQALERFRIAEGINASVPLAYAGRLDPMASGKLLILVGDECKRQETYHGFDKGYHFEVLFGIRSDTGDVLGITERCTPMQTERENLLRVCHMLRGDISLPYPHFSSKTVRGKPLHVWTLEGRLEEIEIPIQRSRIHTLVLEGLSTVTAEALLHTVLKKVDTVPTVTDPRKELGRDFRRTDVRASWKKVLTDKSEQFTIARFYAVASSGTYMRSLGEEIAKKVGTCGLAYAIHRSTIGSYLPLVGNLGLWIKRF